MTENYTRLSQQFEGVSKKYTDLTAKLDIKTLKS